MVEAVGSNPTRPTNNLGGCYDIVKREIEIGDLKLKCEENHTTIELKKARPDRKHIRYTGTRKDLLWMRAYLKCAELELAMNWQDFNMGKDKEDILPWNME